MLSATRRLRRAAGAVSGAGTAKAVQVSRPPGAVICAIDGPSGAGKTTVSKHVARRLRYQLVDTGAFYRSIAFRCREATINPCDESELLRVASSVGVRFNMTDDGVNEVWLSDRSGPGGAERNVTDLIRTDSISRLASTISQVPAVRDIVTAQLREIGKHGKVVMEGRDIGTVVFPDAEVKIFLTASLRVRALRRCRELHKKRLLNSSFLSQLRQLTKSMRARDKADQEREVAPLRQSPEATLVDTTYMRQRQVVHRIAERLKDTVERLELGTQLERQNKRVAQLQENLQELHKECNRLREALHGQDPDRDKELKRRLQEHKQVLERKQQAQADQQAKVRRLLVDRVRDLDERFREQTLRFEERLLKLERLPLIAIRSGGADKSTVLSSSLLDRKDSNNSTEPDCLSIDMPPRSGTLAEEDLSDVEVHWVQPRHKAAQS